MTRIRYSRKAKADLRRIAAYTRATWNDDQAKAYLAALDRVFERLAQFPRSGSKAPNHPGYRKVPCTGSTVYYRIHGDSKVEIVRIIHPRMLAEGRLDPLA